MREVIIIILILIIVLGSAYIIQNFLNKGTTEMVGKLEEIKDDIQQKNMQREDLVKKTDEIYDEWNDINENWSNIVLHEEIDLIETALIRMKSKIETGKIDESLEDINTSIFLLNHIKEKEKTSLKNIF